MPLRQTSQKHRQPSEPPWMHGALRYWAPCDVGREHPVNLGPIDRGFGALASTRAIQLSDTTATCVAPSLNGAL
jgi:hypothetical protein